MSQYLPAYDMNLNNDITLETILNTADNDDIGYIVVLQLNQFETDLTILLGELYVLGMEGDF